MSLRPVVNSAVFVPVRSTIQSTDRLEVAMQRLTCSPDCTHLEAGAVHVVVHCGPGCKFVRGEPIEARVRSVQIVVDPPFFDDFAGVSVAAEQVLVETLVPQSAVEAFNEAILRGVCRVCNASRRCGPAAR